METKSNNNQPQVRRGDIVTYNDKGQIATIMTDNIINRTITQYDTDGHATISQDLGKNDVVNFHKGYIASIIKYEESSYLSEGMNEIQYGENGRLLSSVHKTKISGFSWHAGSGKWMTTDKTTYYDNGHIAAHTTYKQRTKKTRRGTILADNEEEDTAESFISSIEQMDESGKILLSLQFHEFDEVNFHPSGRVASVLRKDKDNNPKSMTSYDENGKILNMMVYQNGRVISTTDYTNGRPTNNIQLGDEQYQNIFDSAKKRVANKSADKIKKKVTKHESVVER